MRFGSAGEISIRSRSERCRPRLKVWPILSRERHVVNPFQSLAEYEEFVYTLQSGSPSIVGSTLVVARRGSGVATLTGELLFANGYRLNVYEILTWDMGPVVIQRYSYEGWRGSDKLYWYDPQPHPNDPSLASTAPHHRHIQPDIKRNRIPARGLSFDQPNLPFLIDEIEHQLPT